MVNTTVFLIQQAKRIYCCRQIILFYFHLQQMRRTTCKRGVITGATHELTALRWIFSFLKLFQEVRQSQQIQETMGCY